MRVWAFLLAASAALPMASGQVAIVDATIVAVVPVRVVVYDFVEGSSYSCEAADLTARGLEVCAGLDAPLQVPTSGETPLGWRESWSDRSTTSETCGYYRAQLGHVACSIGFVGYRRINHLWLYFSAASEAEFFTTGRIHNHWQEQSNGFWDTFRDNYPVGSFNDGCWGAFGNGGGWSMGVEGGIQPRAQRDSCETPAVHGTWGIGVNYRREWGDERIKHHSYVYEYNGGT